MKPLLSLKERRIWGEEKTKFYATFILEVCHFAKNHFFFTLIHHVTDGLNINKLFLLTIKFGAIHIG